MILEEANEVMSFLWERNPTWHGISSREQMLKYLIENKDTVYICRNTTNGEIDGVAIYQKYKDAINFIGLTIRENARLKKTRLRKCLEEIIKKDKIESVSWMNAKYKFRMFKVNNKVNNKEEE